MEFRLLGPLEVVDGERTIALRRQKQRALLAVLALRAPEVVSVDRLVEDLWGEHPPRAAIGSLQNLVSELRKLLGPPVLLTRPPGYVLDVDPDSVDVHRFTRLVREARERKDPDGRAAALRSALALWRGRALADVVFEPFADVESSRLDELLTSARTDLVEAELQRGRHEEIIGEVEALVADEPYDARPRAYLMLALYRSGREAEAIEAYEAARRFYASELNRSPNPTLQKLHGAILRQDPMLDPPERAPIAIVGEERRRTVTVAFTDIVDSTALAADLDPEAFRRVLRRYYRAARETYESHGGAVEKFIGDAVVAIFGIPNQHEDDPLRAVRAAVELHDRLGALNEELEEAHAVTIRIRSGINTGEAVVGGDDSDSLATGYAMNVAAKLQQAAGVGILIGAPTYRLVRDGVAAEAVEPVTLGRHRLPAFRISLLDPDVPGMARNLETPLVGRQHEYDALSELFDEACAERASRLVTVVGEAGIGKSRLAKELALASGERAQVAVGRCVSYGEGATYLPIGEVVRQLVPDGSEAGIATLLGDDKDARFVARRVRELLGWEASPPPPGEGFWAVRKLLEAVARARPLLLLLDDVHWAEPTLLDLVEHLIAQTEDAPMLVLCLARPELVEARPDWPPPLTLDPLSEADVRRLVSNLPGRGDMLPGVRRRIVELAEGNALFAEQLSAYALEEGLEALARVPGSIESVLASRLDRLPENERATLERAAVLGRDFWRGGVEVLAGRDVAPDLEALVGRELIRPARSLIEGEEAFRFHHVLIRDVAYAGITKERRSRLHEQTAAWLDDHEPGSDEIIGYHLEQAYRLQREIGVADETLAERAGDRLASAGMRAWKRTDVPSASNLLGRAVALLPDGERRAELQCELALARLTDGAPDSREAFDRALALATRARCRRLELRLQIDRAKAGIIGSLGFTATPDELLAIAEEALPLLEELGDDRTLGRVWLAVADVHSHRLHNRQWEEAAGRAWHHYSRAGWPGATSLMGQAAALYWGPRPATDGLRRMERLRSEAEDDRWALASLDIFEAGLRAMRGEFPLARALMAGARSTFEDLGGRVQIATTWSGMASEVERLAGDLDARETILRTSLESARMLGQGAFTSTRAWQLADVLYARGLHSEAEQLATIAERHLVDGDLISHIRSRAVRAKLDARTGRPSRAVTLAREARESIAETDALDQHAQTTLDLAEVLWVVEADVREVHALIEEAMALLRRKGNIVSKRAARDLVAALSPT